LGRIGRSWDLVWESFAVLQSDKELVLLPIVSAIFSLSISAVILGVSALLFRPEIMLFITSRQARMPIPPGMWVCIFLFYLANYFVAIFFNVVLVSIASDRLSGGHATLNDGLQIAWERKGNILQWAFLTATVGILLRALEDRMGWLGRMIVGWIGIAWSLATYFVVPILAAEDVSPVEALQRSASIFSETWGEELVGGFSFGLIFFFLALPGIALLFMGIRFGETFAIAGVMLAVIYFLLLAVVSSAVQGVFVAALYRYATTKQVPPGFQRDDFLNAWRPKD
jgi:hypothetical protein